MIRWLVIIVLFYLIWRVLRGLISPDPKAGRRAGQGPRPDEPEDLVRDPVSGVYFPRSQGVASLVEGKVLYFVSRETRDEYLRDRPTTQNGGNG